MRSVCSSPAEGEPPCDGPRSAAEEGYRRRERESSFEVLRDLRDRFVAQHRSDRVHASGGTSSRRVQRRFEWVVRWCGPELVGAVHHRDAIHRRRWQWCGRGRCGRRDLQHRGPPTLGIHELIRLQQRPRHARQWGVDAAVDPELRPSRADSRDGRGLRARGFGPRHSIGDRHLDRRPLRRRRATVRQCCGDFRFDRH